MMVETIGRDWIEWVGGICPVAQGVLVHYKLRNGFESQGPVDAYLCRWDHGRSPEAARDESARRNDIIAYRVQQSDAND